MRWGAFALLLACAGCGLEPYTPDAPDAPTPLQPLTAWHLTDVEQLLPTHPAIEASGELNPSDPDAIDQMLAEGFGDVAAAPGEPHLALTLDQTEPPSPGSDRRLLSRFVHLADAQLTDDESPARFASLDLPGITAFRPQEGHGCRILNAAVRTINAIDAQTPLDFVVLGGDNVDNAQQNEHAWLLAVLGGADRVDCDSGVDDDPVPGPDNDPKDPFVAEGLHVPWLWVTGNHDVLRQGLTDVALYLDIPIGSEALHGTRDWSQHGGPVVKGEVAADPDRAFLDSATIFEAIATDGDGHGIDAAALSMGKASYVHDVAGTPLRMIVIDTASPAGGAEGAITQSDLDAFIRPALDAARDEGKLAILNSHHSSNTLSNEEEGGPVLPGQLTEAQWQAFVASYENVLMHLAGHSHIHRVHRRTQGEGTYWEVITSALADYPHQMRVVEVWDEDNGHISVRLTSLDYATEGDPVASDGRARGVIDFTSGWWEESKGEAEDRNVILYVPKP
ncbi:MAG: metallophosphoesterase [Polyangiaceae bacterium]